MERDQVTSTLEDIGAVVLANACGPCIGQVSYMKCWAYPCLTVSQWKREVKEEENGMSSNSTLSSFLCLVRFGIELLSLVSTGILNRGTMAIL